MFELRMLCLFCYEEFGYYYTPPTLELPEKTVFIPGRYRVHTHYDDVPLSFKGFRNSCSPHLLKRSSASNIDIDS